MPSSGKPSPGEMGIFEHLAELRAVLLQSFIAAAVAAIAAWFFSEMAVDFLIRPAIGPVAGKLHTGRSRNDQVSTDLRLWVRDAIDRVDKQLEAVQRSLVGRCDTDSEIILPAYTHLQRAQPVLAAHYWLAYCEKFDRDRGRLADCRRRSNVCGLGAAALALKAGADGDPEADLDRAGELLPPMDSGKGAGGDWVTSWITSYPPPCP